LATKAALAHTHPASDIVSGLLGIARGGLNNATWTNSQLIRIPVMDTLRKYLTEDYAYCVQALDRGYRAFLNWEIRLDHLRPSRPNTALEFAERDRNSPSYEYKQMMKRYEATSHGSDKRD
jgi:hypothetical protein